MLESETIITVRRQLHGIAEGFIAGPQYRAAGTIRLAVRPDGFTGTALPVAVHGTRLEWPGGAVELAGPVGELVRASGLDFGPPPEDLYWPASPLALDSVLDIDADASELIHRSLYAGATALKAVLPEGHPVLWSEHFDVGVSDDEVNYGVSAGDDFHPLPYAYVGPWDFGTATRPDPFWNAPFGAVHPLEVSADPDALAAGIADFFRLGRQSL